MSVSKNLLAPKYSTNGELLKTYSAFIFSDTFSSILTQSLHQCWWSFLPMSVDRRESKLSRRGEAQPVDDWVELTGSVCPLPDVPEAPFLSGPSPLSVHRYRTAIRMPTSKMRTISIPRLPEKAYLRGGAAY